MKIRVEVAFAERAPRWFLPVERVQTRAAIVYWFFPLAFFALFGVIVRDIARVVWHDLYYWEDGIAAEKRMRDKWKLKARS